MGKIGNRYLEIEPYGVSEIGFHQDRNQVSESIFSLGNEYSGVRGFLEEGVSLPSLIGTYYNGIIEYSLEETPNAYKGIAKRSHFTINSPNYLKCSLVVDGERLDLAKVSFSFFKRSLSFKNGLLSRSFVWHTSKGNNIKVVFERLLGMKTPQNAAQRIYLEAEKPAKVSLSLSIDGSILHWGNHCYWNTGKIIEGADAYGLFMKTISTHQSIVTLMKVDAPVSPKGIAKEEKGIALGYEFDLKANEGVSFTRYVDNLIDKESDENGLAMMEEASKQLEDLAKKGFEGLLKENEEFFSEKMKESDIEIDGDEEDQQGIRFCLFNLQQAYHGLASDNNIGAKGLTGEAYSGHAF